jgi:CRP-like cAMP-binding protein
MRQLHRLVEIIDANFCAVSRECFARWKEVYVQWKESQAELQKNSLIEKVIEVLKTSKRGKRSIVEVEILSKFLVSIACVPKLTAAELKKLSNEVDWVDCTEQTLIFLQGDYGACFYMIAQGSIDLYLETSKDKEMTNCRSFGDLRGRRIQSEDCNQLGKKITSLAEGKGFGEYAILSKTHKFRGATAVTSEERALLLVVFESTYKYRPSSSLFLLFSLVSVQSFANTISVKLRCLPRCLF